MNSGQAYSDAEVRTGVILGLLAYTMWGVFPVYFKWIESVAPTEVLVHRVVWAVPFGALIIMARRQWREVHAAFVDRSSSFCVSWVWDWIYDFLQKLKIEISIGSPAGILVGDNVVQGLA